MTKYGLDNLLSDELKLKYKKYEGEYEKAFNPEGKKFDQNKVRLVLLPFSALEEVANVLTYGAKKYGDYNWTKGIKYSRLLSATLRHMFAWANGENEDKETGLNHLAHAICCLLFILTYILQNKTELDDRN